MPCPRRAYGFVIRIASMAELTWIITLIPALPLAGFLLNVFVIRRERAAGVIASAAVGLACIVTLVSLAVLQAQPGPERRIDFVLWEWFSIGALQVPFGLMFDPLTAVMALLVTGVGAIIHVYSIGYMRGDIRPVRYFAYLNLFIVAMLVLVMADNMLLLFLGWEGVGLCSFLLIGHWFDRRQVPPGINPSDAAVKAFIVNRIGDAGMLLAMAGLLAVFGTLNFYAQQRGGQIVPGYLSRAPEVAFQNASLGIFGSIGVVTAISFLMLIGVVGKSAQVPLYVWLPDAMAGPTPVSALIHAATMVTAGVYLIARNTVLFAASPATSGWVVAVGVLSALLAALAAATQWDIKRVLAYSTISQLGYMVAAVGMGGVAAGMFMLLAHGLYKALLFLAAGSVIHGTHETQDMRKMGGLRTAMPTTFWTFLCGALALAGIFPFAGFWAKDEVIAFAWLTRANALIGILLILTAFITAFYMGRQVALIFFGRQRDASYHPHESGPIMTVPLLLLAAGALLGGLINLPGLHWLGSYLEPVTGEAPEAFSLGQLALSAATLAGAILFGYLGWWLYSSGPFARHVKVGRDDPLHHYLGDIWRGGEIGWGLDWLYERVVIRPFRRFAQFAGNVVDTQGIDGVLVGGVGRVFGWASQGLRRGQSGYFRTYALVFLIGVVLIVGYFAIMS
jgi:NADH-quinone oxidoreductase subunit L